MYKKKYQIKWSDLDPNIHMRHSAYNDYAAQTRLLFMSEHGFGMDWFKKHDVYPVLFREETIYMKEILGNETITVDAQLQKMSKDGSKWSIVNRFFKENGTLAAQLTVDGAWMNPHLRKLTVPPATLMHLFDKLEKTDDFSWLPEKNANPNK